MVRYIHMCVDCRAYKTHCLYMVHRSCMAHMNEYMRLRSDERVSRNTATLHPQLRMYIVEIIRGRVKLGPSGWLGFSDMYERYSFV